MEKRRRGRPRKKMASPSPTLAKQPVLTGKAPYSDDLPEFFRIYIPLIFSNTLKIPADFIDKVGVDMSRRSWKLERRPSGASWQVDTNMIGDSWFLDKGWPEFVQKNSLEDSDLLTFCYLGSSTFSVTIFSSNGCAKEDDNDGDGQDTSSSSSMSDDDDETSESEETESSRVMKRQRARVDDSSTKPSFSVTMSATYKLRGFMTVPMKFWNRYMRENEEKNGKGVKLFVNNESWNVELVQYDGRIAFRRGCAKFYKDNSIKIGTLCTFHLIHSTPFSFKVTITL